MTNAEHNERNRLYYARTRETRLAAQRKHDELHPEKRLERARRYRKLNADRIFESRLLYKYGLTLKEYNALVASQGGKCKICNQEAELFVDHCHDTNRVRGLLCRACNLILGWAKDDQTILIQAIYYLRSNNDT